MPRYRVDIDIHMAGTVEVDAEDEDEARELADDDDLIADFEQTFDRGVQVGVPVEIDEEVSGEG